MNFATPGKFEAISNVLSQSRWFDPVWMELGRLEGYPRLGCFGLRSEPDYQGYAFYHDLAHALVAVQDGEGWRLGRYGFGLQYTTTQEIMGQTYDTPMTDQAVQLELRVIAMQYHLTYMDTVNDPVLEKETKDDFFKAHVGPLKYMEDHLMTRIRLREQGLTGDTKYYSDDEEKVILQHLIDQCRDMADAIQSEHVIALWQQTCEVGRQLKQLEVLTEQVASRRTACLQFP